MSQPDRLPDEREPIVMICEGSGCPSHAGSMIGRGICSMCGQDVAARGRDNIAELHARRDLLAMIERGDFDQPATLTQEEPEPKKWSRQPGELHHPEILDNP